MGGGGGGEHRVTTHTNVIKYAPYIEVQHKPFLTAYETRVPEATETTPFDDFEVSNYDAAFFSAGNTIVNYSNSFTLFKTFQLDIDFNLVFNSSLDRVMKASNSNDLVAAEQANLNTELETKKSQQMQADARDINAVLSTSFIISKTNREKKRLKALAEYSKEVKLKRINDINIDVENNLAHSRSLITDYMEMLKGYFETSITMDENEFGRIAQKFLWPFTVTDQWKRSVAILEVPNNIDLTKPHLVGPRPKTKTQRAVSGVVTGLQVGIQIGTYIGGWIGAIVGAIIGGIAGYFM